MNRADGWAWRGPALVAVLVGIGVALTLVGTTVADVWHAVVARIGASQ